MMLKDPWVHDLTEMHSDSSLLFKSISMKILVCQFVAVLFGILLFVSDSTISADDLPDGVKNTQNVADISLTPEESLSRISVPEDFQVTLFAAEPDIRRPIAFDFDDQGRLWVVENYSHPHWDENKTTDRIVILEDTDNDGIFDKRKVFYDQGRYLTGIALGHGGVWIANTPELSFIPDRDRDDQPDSDPEVLLDGFQISTNNVLNNFHWGPDGWLYGAIGLSSVSKVGPPGAPSEERVRISRGIWRFHPVTHVFEKVAEGMVNPWGADFNEYGDLITANTVIAHLWHIVPGMYCERRAAERDNPYAYGRIQTIANHLHWGGGGWQSSRSPENKKQINKQPTDKQNSSQDEYHQHSVAGGGHAHCGAMIYLGDNWPEKYRGTFFTNNLHGSRVNNDKLIPRKSSYVGEHSEDLLFANDPWFRGMSVKYGPDGGVFISDWHDFGECHDADGSHRTSGRIYKFVYGKPGKPPRDLHLNSSLELAKLHTHRNEWIVRHARRILHERAIAGTDIEKAAEQLWRMFSQDHQEPHQLRAFWTLYCIGELDEGKLLSLLPRENEHVRRWAIRFLVDEFSCDTTPSHHHAPVVQQAVLDRFVELATHDLSAKVRLELACALQRLSYPSRLKIAAALSGHAEDVTDPYIPLMIWYGLEPAVIHHMDAALEIAQNSAIPIIRQYIARRLIDQPEPAIDKVIETAYQRREEYLRRDFLQGVYEAMEGLGTQQVPSKWDQLYDEVKNSADPGLRSLGLNLATIFGDKQAIRNLQLVVLDSRADEEKRKTALASLKQLDKGVSVEMLHKLVREDSEIRREAILALDISNNPATVEVLLEQYATFSQDEKQAAVSLLATRQHFAIALLDLIESGTISREDVSAYTLQQLKSFNVTELQDRLQALWANDQSKLLKSEEIANYEIKMSSEFLSQGNASAGRLVFERTCAKCHRLFGEGGDIAPDLTGSGRKKPDYILRNLIDPSAEIDAAYRLTTVLTDDGRLYNGFMVHQDDKWLIIRTQDAKIRLSMNEVDELVKSKASMMPEGMLRSFTDEQIRDLLVYLASDDQVPLPAEIN